MGDNEDNDNINITSSNILPLQLDIVVSNTMLVHPEIKQCITLDGQKARHATPYKCCKGSSLCTDCGTLLILYMEMHLIIFTQWH